MLTMYLFQKRRKKSRNIVFINHISSNYACSMKNKILTNTKILLIISNIRHMITIHLSLSKGIYIYKKHNNIIESKKEK